jgi:hypothetical protein
MSNGFDAWCISITITNCNVAVWVSDRPNAGSSVISRKMDVGFPVYLLENDEIWQCANFTSFSDLSKNIGKSDRIRKIHNSTFHEQIRVGLYSNQKTGFGGSKRQSLLFMNQFRSVRQLPRDHESLISKYCWYTARRSLRDPCIESRVWRRPSVWSMWTFVRWTIVLSTNLGPRKSSK